MDSVFNIEAVNLNGINDAETAIRSLGADPRGVEIMREKAVFRVIRVQAVTLRAANLIKQTFLAHGAEAAVSREAAALKAERTDVLMMATLAQYRRAIETMREQPFGLRALSERLEKFLWNDDVSYPKGYS